MAAWRCAHVSSPRLSGEARLGEDVPPRSDCASRRGRSRCGSRDARHRTRRHGRGTGRERRARSRGHPGCPAVGSRSLVRDSGAGRGSRNPGAHRDASSCERRPGEALVLRPLPREHDCRHLPRARRSRRPRGLGDAALRPTAANLRAGTLRGRPDAWPGEHPERPGPAARPGRDRSRQVTGPVRGFHRPGGERAEPRDAQPELP